MEISFHSHANKTHFHKKGCAPSLILKVRVFGPRKWPIITLVLTAARFVVCFSSQLRSWISIWLINNSSIHYLKIKRLWILKGHKLSLPVRGLTQLHNSQTYRPLAFRLFLLLLLLFCFVFAMNNKLTIGFGFRKIWKRKKKKKKEKKKGVGMGWRDLKDWSPDSAAVNFDKKKHPPTPPTVLVSTRALYLRSFFEVISVLIIQK